MTTPTVFWFRQDLRLHDHPGLHAALAENAPIIPLYVFDEDAVELGGANRWWLHHSLERLGESLKTRGAPLILRRGNAARIIPALASENGVRSVHAGAAMEPAWRARDVEIAASLQTQGCLLVRHRVATLSDPHKIVTKTGSIYGVYSPYARMVESQLVLPPPLPAPAGLPGVAGIASENLADWGLLPATPDWATGLRAEWTPGEQGAATRLRVFLEHAGTYNDGRNLPGQPATSMLSPHLHFGEISPASVWSAIAGLGEGAGVRSFLRELLWREFSLYLLWHHKTLPTAPLRPAFENLPWRDDPAALTAWQRGETGVPIIDAGMRQLWQTGWMHNRVRMITASFLVKHLLIDWRVGARWFWDTLVDADLASNSASWQWVAGTGIDAQPFFRVFNPVTQGEKFDADGTYVRRFVPELAALPPAHIHAPWAAPSAILAMAGVKLGQTYPHPIIDLAEGRRRALATYQAAVRDQAA